VSGFLGGATSPRTTPDAPEKIRIAETKKSGVEAVEKTNRDKKREYAHYVPVDVESVPSPRMNP
jgi:hypothetical protein